MKNKFLFVVSILFAAGLILSACGPKEESSSVSLPALSVAESTEAPAVENQPANAYPAGAVQSASSAYPAGTLAVMSDAEVEAMLVEKLGGHHALDWVLQFDKTRAEWEQLLSDHHGVTFTPEEKEAVITYLLNH